MENKETKTPLGPPSEPARSLSRQRPRSLSRGTERRLRERETTCLPLEAAPADRAAPAPLSAGAATAARAAPAPLSAGPAPRAPPTTPHRSAEPPPALSGAHAETPHRMQPTTAAACPAAPEKKLPPVPLATKPGRSPKSELESDWIIVSRLTKAKMLSGHLARAIAMNLHDRRQLLEEGDPSSPDEEEMTAARNFAALTPLPETIPAATLTLKRQRTQTDIKQGDAAPKLPKVAAQEDPLPQRDPRLRRTTTPHYRAIEMDHEPSTSSQPQPSATDNQRPTTSFADAAKKRPGVDTTAAASQGPSATQTGPNTASPPKQPKYPPLIVESLPNWAHHLRQLKSKLGRTPSARPFGKGIKFTPADDQEYRLIQRYLTEIEKEEKISWFSYSLPQDRDLKVAIRGIPAETDPMEIADELRTLGFEPEVVRPIKARQGRPGCIFFAILKRTPDLTPAIYKVSELMCMPGVLIEAWRGKKGPAQCHRCQQFRHSSHNCHRKQACVRCGEEHSAHECPRPREEPATCANCGGPHPSNNLSCPVFRREARNKRAGTVATTAGQPREDRPKSKSRPPREEEKADQPAPAGSNLRTEANDPTPRGEKLKTKKKKTKKTKQTKASTAKAPVPPPAQEGEKEKNQDRPAVIESAIQVLSDILIALRAGEDPVDVVLRGMSSILKLNG